MWGLAKETALTFDVEPVAVGRIKVAAASGDTLDGTCSRKERSRNG
jgi:hypothetical protein